MHTCRTRYPISEIFTQFGELIVKMLRMPVRNSALHCVVRTFIHIDVDLPRAPTAAQKESLPEIPFCKSCQILSEPLAPLQFRGPESLDPFTSES